MKENPVGDPVEYKFKFTVTPPPPTREEIDAQLATIGEYYDYFNFSSVIGWSKKKWVPFWLWKLVADGHFIGEEIQ